MDCVYKIFWKLSPLLRWGNKYKDTVFYISHRLNPFYSKFIISKYVEIYLNSLMLLPTLVYWTSKSWHTRELLLVQITGSPCTT